MKPGSNLEINKLTNPCYMGNLLNLMYCRFLGDSLILRRLNNRRHNYGARPPNTHYKFTNPKILQLTLSAGYGYFKVCVWPH